jgi:putative transcriptional regulator
LTTQMLETSYRAGGARKLRWAAKGKGKRGGARIIYLYLRMPKKTAAKKTSLGKDLIEGMQMVLAHQRGKIELEQVWPKPIDVKAIRKRVKMSQAEFSRAYGISKRALQEWEQGGRQPDSAARAYLTVIAKRPAVVRRALASE